MFIGTGAGLAEVPGHPGREPVRRLFRQRVPDAREPDAAPSSSRCADTPLAREPPGGGARGRQRGDGRGAHGVARLGAETRARSSTAAPSARCRPDSRRSITPRQEGVVFELLQAPTRVLGDERGWVERPRGAAHGAGRARRERPAPARADPGQRARPGGGHGDRRHRQRAEPARAPGHTDSCA